MVQGVLGASYNHIFMISMSLKCVVYHKMLKASVTNVGVREPRCGTIGASISKYDKSIPVEEKMCFTSIDT